MMCRYLKSFIPRAIYKVGYKGMTAFSCLNQRCNCWKFIFLGIHLFHSGEALLTPTRIYSKTLLPAVRSGRVKAFAHITGGGLLENIPRIMPGSMAVQLDASKWEIPSVFGWISHHGGVEELEMARTFNCGIGGVLVVRAEDEGAVLEMVRQNGEKAWRIGQVVPKCGGE